MQYQLKVKAMKQNMYYQFINLYTWIITLKARVWQHFLYPLDNTQVSVHIQYSSPFCGSKDNSTTWCKWSLVKRIANLKTYVLFICGVAFFHSDALLVSVLMFSLLLFAASAEKLFHPLFLRLPTSVPTSLCVLRSTMSTTHWFSERPFPKRSPKSLCSTSPTSPSSPNQR